MDSISHPIELITALGGNPTTGMCQCPVPGHGKGRGDRNPSLHVSEGNNGKVLVHCHGGCAADAVVGALRARGLWASKGNKPTETAKAKPKAAEDSLGPNHGEYERFRRGFAILRAAALEDAQPSAYLEGRGINQTPPNAMQLSASKARKLKLKGFPAMVLPITDNAGKLRGAHVTSLNRDGTAKLNCDKPKRMFGTVKGGFVKLGEPDPDRPLIIAEGVETALSASQIAGVPAIAGLSATNMEKVTPPSCSEVIIAADNDPSGRNAARRLARRLGGPDKIVRLVWPEGDEGLDYNDVLRNGHDPEAVRHSLLHAKPLKWTGVQPVTMGQFLDLEFPAVQYLLRPWLATSSLAMVHALRGHGKTHFVFGVAYAVATGEAFMDWPVEKTGRVLYLDGELSGGVLKSRLEMLGPPTDNLFLLSDAMYRLKGLTMPKIDDAEGQRKLDEIIEREKIDLVIIDSLSTLCSPEIEKDPGPWMPVQAWALQHRSRGRSIVFVHHDSRGNKPRGHSKKEDVLDTMLQLKLADQPQKDDETILDLGFTKHRSFHGVDAAPLCVRLSVRSGHMEWSAESAKENTRNQVTELLRQGFVQKDIAKEIGITAGRVSQIVKEIKMEEAARTAG